MQGWKQLVDSDNAFTVDFAAQSCANLTTSYASATYVLTNMKFHSPSEHTLGGSYFAAEVQLTHVNAANSSDYIVLSLLLDETTANAANNAFLANLWAIGDDDISTLSQTITVSPSTNGVYLNPYIDMLPPNKQTYHYSGSFTTPTLACASGVEWFVFVDAVPVSSEDIANLRGVMNALNTRLTTTTDNNNRPTQALNSRVIELLSGELVYTNTPTATPTPTPTGAPTSVYHDHHVHLKKTTTEKALIIGSVALGTTGILDIMVFAVIILLMIEYAKVRRAHEAEAEMAMLMEKKSLTNSDTNDDDDNYSGVDDNTSKGYDAEENENSVFDDNNYNNYSIDATPGAGPQKAILMDSLDDDETKDNNNANPVVVPSSDSKDAIAPRFYDFQIFGSDDTIDSAPSSNYNYILGRNSKSKSSSLEDPDEPTTAATNNRNNNQQFSNPAVNNYFNSYPYNRDDNRSASADQRDARDERVGDEQEAGDEDYDPDEDEDQYGDIPLMEMDQLVQGRWEV
jgi:carbonic anhydrase